MSVLNEILLQVRQLTEEIEHHIAKSVNGEVITHGIRVAIVGAPNVGKSSLMNILAKRNVAIVADIAGTTRDVIEVKVDLDGYAVIFYDTAGIRETSDSVELEGIRRAKKAAEESDITIYLMDVPNGNILEELADDPAKPVLVVLNKIDLLEQNALNQIDPDKVIGISATANIGLDKLLNSLMRLITDNYSLSEDPIITKERYRQLLTECTSHLNQFNLSLKLDIATEYIRLAAGSVAMITGQIEVEHILDEIFSSFCIGK